MNQIKVPPLGEHQVDTIEFMISMEVEPTDDQNMKRGGVIALDMGCGKTYCAIATMLAIPKSTLIIVPLSLADQWAVELKRFGDIVPWRIYGKNSVLPDDDDLVVLMTIPEFMSAEKRKLVSKVRWGRIIVDEAHRARNQKSELFKALLPMAKVGQKSATKAVKADVRWALTGTPLQNKKTDLESLFAWMGLNPKHMELLLPRYYKRWSQQSVSALNTKTTLQDVQFVDCEIVPENDGEKKMIDFWEQKFCTMNIGNKALDSLGGKALIALQRCRQAATHPALPILGVASSAGKGAKKQKKKNDSEDIEYTDDEEETDDMETDTSSSSDDEEPTKYKKPVPSSLMWTPMSSRDYSKLDLTKLAKIAPHLASCFKEGEHVRSTKIDKMAQMISEHPTEKTLVFCHWEREMNAIQQVLNTYRIPTLVYNGKMKDNERNAVVKQFENFKAKKGLVLLMQFECGSVGLNLSSASRVYFPTPHWNPFMELQALARAHRHGQQGLVVCTRFWVKDTVEERVRQLQQQKMRLVHEILNDSSFEQRFHDKEISEVDYVFQSKWKELRAAEAAAAAEKKRQENEAKEAAKLAANGGGEITVTTKVTKQTKKVQRVTKTTVKKISVPAAVAKPVVAKSDDVAVGGKRKWLEDLFDSDDE
jgi:SNF2 family DNA or RNA helicase